MPVSRTADAARRLPLRAVVLAAAVVAAAAALAALAIPAAAQTKSQDRRVEINAMEYPWSAIGRLNAGGRGHCTGFLVGERHVLTAAHCLYDPVVGRWRGAIELHFIAGYQRDRFILHSKVASYRRAANFTYVPRPDTAVAADDWAVLTLAEPLGRQAGWLGMKALDSLMMSRIEAGDALLLHAGYRRDRQHVMSAGWGCALRGILEGGRLLLHDCDVVQGDSGSPLLLFADGRFYAIGLHTIDLVLKETTHLGGVLSLAIFHPANGPRGTDPHGSSGGDDAAAALAGTSVRWTAGQPPPAGSPAGRTAATTLDGLLAGLRASPAAAPPVSLSDR